MTPNPRLPLDFTPVSSHMNARLTSSCRRIISSERPPVIPGGGVAEPCTSPRHLPHEMCPPGRARNGAGTKHSQSAMKVGHGRPASLETCRAPAHPLASA